MLFLAPNPEDTRGYQFNEEWPWEALQAQEGAGRAEREARGGCADRRGCRVLQRHCERARRSYDEIERTTLGTVRLAPGAMTPSDVVRTCRELAELGIQHAIFNMPTVDEITPLEILGREVIPEVEGF